MTDKTYKIGVIGGGFVGGATKCLASERVKCFVYDLDASKCSPQGTTFEDILGCEAVFVAVPTPITVSDNEENGKCNTKIVDAVVKQLKQANYSGYIIIRSTVPVGYCASQNVYFMPEFLTERNWKQDFLTCTWWIFGLQRDDSEEQEFMNWMTGLIEASPVEHKECCFVSSKEAEMIKYFRNCFLATKVAFCNEMYTFAAHHQLQWDRVIANVVKDTRIGGSHTKVPGFDGKFGFSGTCFPKDCASLVYQFKQAGVANEVVAAAVRRNETIDRPEKDWLQYHQS